MDPAINIDSYRHMLQELGAMKGDVLGLINVASHPRQLAARDIRAYRQKLRAAGRKDRFIFVGDSRGARPALSGARDVIAPRRLKGYDPGEVFDIAICDGKVFVSRLRDGGVEVQLTDDQVTYHAYTKFFNDLWIGADRMHRPTSAHDINLTFNELTALLQRHNVASAHNLHSLTEQQDRIIDTLPALWRSTHHTQQADIERDFLTSFFEYRRAPAALSEGQNFIAYSASAIIALAADFLRSLNKSVSLISPCVDLIPDLLKDGGIVARALPEGILHDPAQLYQKLTEQVTTDAVFLVNPNNPTGFCLDEFGAEGFEELARYCRDYRKLLIVDLCFMPFVCRDGMFSHVDCYRIFNQYNIDYITVEDSGKFLPTMDMKAAVLHVSRGLASQFARLHTNLMLRHSPFILKTMTAFIQDALATDSQETAAIVQANVAYLERSLRNHNLPLTVERRRAEVSVAWVRSSEPRLSARVMQTIAREQGIEVLTGPVFFWDNPRAGRQYVRFALARDPEVFRETIDTIAAALQRALPGLPAPRSTR